MWEGKLFSYILSSPSRAEQRRDDGARPPPQGIRGCPLGVPAWGASSGVPAWGCAVGASAAPCSADFDPPRRTAPAWEGAAATLRPRSLWARGCGSRRPLSRVTRGGGGRSRSPVRVLFPCPSVGRVFSWEPSVWSGACIAGGRGGARRPAPSRAQEGGREHPRRGRPPEPTSPPSCGERSETFVRRPLDQFFASSGASLPPPIRPAVQSLGGRGAASRG